uniref:CSON010028 protein n=1 Tax=Culicoides sonorensis TaxID=179676 RepID=A0A336MZ00_CULSO
MSSKTVFLKINPAPVVSLVDVGYLTSSSSFNISPVKVNFSKPCRPSIKGQSRSARHNRKLDNLGVLREYVPNLPNCSSNCHVLSSKDDRQLIWDEFRKIHDLHERARYIASLILVAAPRQQKKNSSRNRNNRKIRTIVSKKIKTGQSNDISYTRGKQPPANKVPTEHVEQAQLFLLSVPQYESHYGRSQSNKRYLPYYHTKSSLFEDFTDHYPENKVKFDMFSQIFKTLNLSIKAKSIDTCKNCDEFANLLNTEISIEEKEEIKVAQQAHWTKWQAATTNKSCDIALSKCDNSIKVIAYDLQQILPTPYLSTSVAFYSRLLSTFNLTVYDLGTSISHHHMWHEGVGKRGANEINSCLHKYCMQLPLNIKHLIKYSDRCPGQNLNIQTVIASLFLLQESHSLEIIDSKYLVSGHTHMEVDSAHAQIERHKKKTKEKIEVPQDWYNLVDATSNKFHVDPMAADSFLNFSASVQKKGHQKRKLEI